ncbi:hypothetical protein OBBRIDRAFT_802461 [Obba rivulosa]|uniref:Uncharacterized protein n=1 Tax=Obba rivulosa TaxID=1052685 RepID=A0A8E2DMD2_9APHY|nr:hypothetical protein OBBRIDRAFT_802461 [Obba rivulosa]
MATYSLPNQTTPCIRWFVPVTDTRGTFDIIQTCVPVLLFCFWTVQHPDVGKDGQSTHFGKLYLACLTIFAPEVAFVQAVDVFIKARHMHHVCPKWSMDECFYAAMHGFTLEGKERLAWEDIVVLVEKGYIGQERTNLAQIRDKSKSDWIVKLLAIAQTSSFIWDCITRVRHRLPLSTLELGTIGYVVIAFAVCLIYLRKPQDVATTIPIHLLHGIPYQHATQVISDRRGVQRKDPEKVTSSPLLEGPTRVPLSAIPPARGRYGLTHWELLFARTSGIAMGVQFGIWHCLAWNHSFPTAAEQQLWHVCALLSIVLLPLWVVGIAARPYIKGAATWYKVLLGLDLFICVFARGFLLVEMFIGLRCLSLEMYETM